MALAERIQAHTAEALSSPASRHGEPGPLASPQAHGLGLAAYHTDLVTHIEHLVDVLAGAELSMSLLERYERALTRGHAANLRRLRRTQED